VKPGRIRWNWSQDSSWEIQWRCHSEYQRASLFWSQWIWSQTDSSVEPHEGCKKLPSDAN